MKTAELEGAALDYWVAKTEGRCLHEQTRTKCGNWGTDFICIACGKDAYNEITTRDWKPSTDWAQGGPIIERERIELEPTVFDWSARVDGITGWWFAKTPLIAAMRAFVASKFGDEVEDIPSC